MTAMAAMVGVERDERVRFRRVASSDSLAGVPFANMDASRRVLLISARVTIDGNASLAEVSDWFQFARA